MSTPCQRIAKSEFREIKSKTRLYGRHGIKPLKYKNRVYCGVEQFADHILCADVCHDRQPPYDQHVKISEGITRDCLVFEPDLANLTSLFDLKLFGAPSRGILKKRKVKLLFRRVENQNLSVGCSKAVPAIERGDPLFTSVIGGSEHSIKSARHGERDRNAKNRVSWTLEFSGSDLTKLLLSADPGERRNDRTMIPAERKYPKLSTWQETGGASLFPIGKSKLTLHILSRWAFQHNRVIPKFANPSRIRENAEAFDVENTDEDLRIQDDFNENLRACRDTTNAP